MMDGAKRSCVGLRGRQGVCMAQRECTEMNGKSVGKCFPFESCCSGMLRPCISRKINLVEFFKNFSKPPRMIIFNLL